MQLVDTVCVYIIYKSVLLFVSLAAAASILEVACCGTRLPETESRQ